MSQHAIDIEQVFEPFGAARKDGKQVANTAAFLKKNAPDMHKWLLELFGWDGGINAHVVLRDRKDDDEEAAHFSISIWSATYEFVVSAQRPTGKTIRRVTRSNGKSKYELRRDEGYLGAGLVARSPYAGEQHRRASDLYDGAYNEKTWRGILHDILINSIVELHNWKRPKLKRRKRK